MTLKFKKKRSFERMLKNEILMDKSDKICVKPIHWKLTLLRELKNNSVNRETYHVYGLHVWCFKDANSS